MTPLPRKLYRRGELAPAAKLTEADVRAIRLAVKNRTKNTGTIRQLAIQFRVSRMTIWNVLKGVHWNHVQ